jgi:hypothetical protein
LVGDTNSKSWQEHAEEAFGLSRVVCDTRCSGGVRVTQDERRTVSARTARQVLSCEQERADQDLFGLERLPMKGLLNVRALCNLPVVTYCLLVLFNVGLGRPARALKETMFLLA